MFLGSYRATPVTGKSPHEMMTGRMPHTKIPQLSKTPHETHQEVLQRHNLEKHKQKKYAEDCRKTVPHNFKPGDLVLVKQSKQDKLSTPFDPIPIPYTTEKGKGSMISAESA